MVLEILGDTFGQMIGTFGVVAMTILSIIIVTAIGIGGWLLMKWMRDYPIDTTFWTVRSNGLVPVQDKVGIFFDKKEGKQYWKSRKYKFEGSTFPFSKIEPGERGGYGKINLIRKSNFEFIPVSTPELIKLIEKGEMAPVVKDEVRYFMAQGVRRDHDLLIKGGLMERWGTLITLSVICVILFLTFILFGGIVKDAMGFGGSLQQSTDNVKTGQLYDLKTAQINLLIYSLYHNVTIADSVNYTKLFSEINVTQIIPGEKVIR
jgi:hypothetical protein